MIFFVEGLSKAGKTTFIDNYLIKNPYAIRFKGEGQVKMGIDTKWDEYNFYMHNIIERLDELQNYQTPILWDRGISQGIFDDYKWIRLAKAHAHKAVIFIDVTDNNILRKRVTSERNCDTIRDRYNERLQGFSTFKLKTDWITDSNINDIDTFIISEMEKINELY